MRIISSLLFCIINFACVQSFTTYSVKKLNSVHNSLLMEISGPAGSGSVVIFSTAGCKYCRQAKAKLEELSIPYYNIDVNNVNENELNSEYLPRLLIAKRSTVPQIYVGDEHVGGFDKLDGEIGSGIFFQRLARWGIRDQVATNDPLKCDNAEEVLVTISGSPNIALNEYEISGIVKSSSDIKEAAQLSSDPVELSKRLKEFILLLSDKYYDPKLNCVDYIKLKSSLDMAKYIQLSSLLAQLKLPVLLSSLKDESSRKAFFLNLYNALVIHANAFIRPPENNPESRSLFFTGKSGAYYNLAGFSFSLDDIEHGILRGNRAHPSKIPPEAKVDSAPHVIYFEPNDERASLALTSLDPRIHFALNCGAVSCPPI